jgi:hypothetical protein
MLDFHYHPHHFLWSFITQEIIQFNSIQFNSIQFIQQQQKIIQIKHQGTPHHSTQK